MNTLWKRVVLFCIISFVIGNLNYWFFHRLKNISSGRKIVSSDVKMVAQMIGEAGEHLGDALKAEQKSEFEEAARKYDMACKAFRRLVMATYYKKCCDMFETKKYSATLDELISFLKFDPEISQVYFSTGGNIIGRMYVCMYSENGSDDADEWLRETMTKLNDDGKRFSLALLNRSISKLGSVTNERFSASEKSTINILVQRLGEIDERRQRLDVDKLDDR